MTNYRLANYNELLKDYVLKQDLKKNFTEYKNAADRKELFRRSVSGSYQGMAKYLSRLDYLG